MFFFDQLWKKNPPPDEAQERSEAPARSNVKCIHRMSFSGIVVSDVGCVRENNEDNYILEAHTNTGSCDHSEASVSVTDWSLRWHFAGVFDGMGGGELGEIASEKTAQIFRSTFSQVGKGTPKAGIDQLAKEAFLEANNMIIALQKEHNVYGTTGTVLCTNNEEFKIFHLGDSRAYLFRDGELYQLTKDQTLAQMKIDAGLFDENAPNAKADRHKLTEYIGRDRTQENLHPVGSEWISVQKADRLLLCSDGLYDMCSDEEIKRTLKKRGSLEMHARELVETARRSGGVDNITCLIVAFS